ncbi:hypothetical protein K0M31_010042 [Melipona bicolor]|uniref:Uncharacterized protein n=1 Tax=Melipona bicolor TaxID=60889 RepID=A0AA40FMR9_9HYME|nr:hypothetical protein K0M31_010042 [Melipona bicolor]
MRITEIWEDIDFEPKSSANLRVKSTWAAMKFPSHHVVSIRMEFGLAVAFKHVVATNTRGRMPVNSTITIEMEISLYHLQVESTVGSKLTRGSKNGNTANSVCGSSRETPDSSLSSGSN